MLRRALRAVAAGALLTGPGLVAPVAASASAPAAPSHVAIVVGGVGGACVPWHSGMTGFDVLDAQRGGGFTVTYGQQPPYIGFVFTIGGVGSARPDNTHYWAYFHDTGGGWQYSGTGGASYHPQPGTVEGWSYVDGQTTALPPSGKSYADLCGGQDPSPRPTPTARRSTTAASPAPAATAPARTREPPPTSSPATADPRTATNVPDVHTARATKASSSAGSAAPSPSTTTAQTGGVTTAAVLPVAVQGRRGGSGSSGLPTAGTALGLLAVVVIGSAAYRQARRNRNGRAP